LDEKQYLKTKVQQLISQMATPEQLKFQKDTIQHLEERASHLVRVQLQLESMISEQELRFVRSVVELYDKYLGEATKQKNQKMRKDLLLLGKWNFLKDWLAEKSVYDKTMGTLLDNILSQPLRFKAIIPEEEVFAVHEFDSLDLRDLKVLF
jgi:hypothetical protein